MPESTSHKQAKRKAAGDSGETEKPLRRRRRLDAATSHRATEIERSGDLAALKRAARRLRDSGKRQKVLQVPQQDMAKAVQAMRDVGISGTVKNMGGTKRRSVRKRKK
jgi:hypothetical protein